MASSGGLLHERGELALLVSGSRRMNRQIVNYQRENP
jgi:hypothetical protein